MKKKILGGGGLSRGILNEGAGKTAFWGKTFLGGAVRGFGFGFLGLGWGGGFFGGFF